MKKSHIKTFIFLLFVVALIIAGWKYRHIFNFSFDDIKIASEDKNRTSYDIYKAKIHRAGKNIYYLKIEDIICDGAADYGGNPHYFRINVAI